MNSRLFDVGQVGRGVFGVRVETVVLIPHVGEMLGGGGNEESPASNRSRRVSRRHGTVEHEHLAAQHQSETPAQHTPCQ